MISKEEILKTMKHQLLPYTRIKHGDVYMLNKTDANTILKLYKEIYDYINQQPQLDTTIEEALVRIAQEIGFKDLQKVDKEFDTIKQAFITQRTKSEEIDKALKEYFELEDKILTGKVSDNCKYEDLERYKELEKKLRGKL